MYQTHTFKNETKMHRGGTNSFEFSVVIFCEMPKYQLEIYFSLVRLRGLPTLCQLPVPKHFLQHSLLLYPSPDPHDR